MVGKISVGAGFGGTLQYIMDGDGRNHKQVRVLDHEGVNVRMGDKGQPEPNIGEVARSFRLQAMMNPDVEKPVIHVTLSWSPEDAPRLTDAEMISAAKDYLQRMGWDNTQYFMARHLEKDNPHMHIVLNKVDNDGKRLNDSFYKLNNKDVCRAITEERNYTLGRPKMVSAAKDISDPREDLRYRIAQETTKAISQVTDIRQLPQVLSKVGITCVVKEDSKGIPRGISFTGIGKDGREYHFSGAQVDRNLTAKNICHAINNYEKVPEMLKEARWMDGIYKKAATRYNIPPDVREKCQELNRMLRQWDREEKRLEKDIASAKKDMIKDSLLAILNGDALGVLIAILQNSFILAMKNGEIQPLRENRERTVRETPQQTLDIAQTPYRGPRL